MKNDRCLISGIKPKMLTEVLTNIVEQKLGAEVVGIYESNTNIENLVNEKKASVVIMGINDTQLPNEFRALLATEEARVGVGVVNDGRIICVCSNAVLPEKLASLITCSLLA